ncbi:hypothetical protein DFJ77DRAFT_91528 [Powellomyces hirtus]|nr:hypothetical protein DFJ77DRAFT_91528 [Powellomyces hirtus]
MGVCNLFHSLPSYKIRQLRGPPLTFHPKTPQGSTSTPQSTTPHTHPPQTPRAHISPRTQMTATLQPALNGATPFTIFIRSRGTRHTFIVDKTTRVAHLKSDIARRLATHAPAGTRLVCGSKELADANTLADYPCVREGCDVDLIARCPGGAH